MTHSPDAVVLTAPDRCTAYLFDAVERSLADMAPETVLEVPCDPFSRMELAEWCLAAGHRIANPFDHWQVPHLLIERVDVAGR